MRQLLPALVVAVVGFSSAHADPAKPFSNKSFGDGGGYKHPDADVGQYFETKPDQATDQKPAELKPGTPPLPAKASPEIRPIALVPSRPRPRPFGGAKSDAPSRLASARSEETPKNLSIAKADPTSADDAASEDARRDYESRLFGAVPGPRRPELSGAEEKAPAASFLSAVPSEGMLFVSLELDAKEASSLRDAVAGLGAAAAFRPDSRFQPMPGEGGSVRISGWLPASRLGDAIARPGVKRVAVERGSRPAPDERVTGDYLMKLRVNDAAHPDESIAAGVREMSARTGFKLERVLGFETIPGGGPTALVSGRMPVSQLSRALSLPGVLDVSSTIPVAGVSSSDAVYAARKQGFFKFVWSRSLWLILLTVLLALPTIGDVVKSGLSVFVPYR